MTKSPSVEYGLRSREAPLAQRLVKAPLFWIALLATLAFTWMSVRMVSGPVLPQDPIGELPAFEFRDQHSAPFGTDRFRGRVSIVNFIFTSCPDVCPLLTRKMKEMKDKAAKRGLDLQFVSISVDPETDTPDVLKSYASVHEAEAPNWFFLTGPLDLIQSVIVDSFKVAVLRGQTAAAGQAPNPADSELESLMEITHGEQFALVDRQARIRAYRRGDQNAALNELLDLSEAALAEKN